MFMWQYGPDALGSGLEDLDIFITVKAKNYQKL